jgi:hypothetical protein
MENKQVENDKNLYIHLFKLRIVNNQIKNIEAKIKTTYINLDEIFKFKYM